MTKLVIYAICKDEIANADLWYNSMKEADEVIVLDTGSTDGTPERLEELGATVYRDYPGPFRFDTARNASLQHVPEDADICFATDLDERFNAPGWCAEFKKAWENTPGCNSLDYRFVHAQQPGPDGVLQDVSVFYKDNAHSRRGWHWTCPCHNLLVPDEGVKKIAGRVPDTVSLVHHQLYKGDRAGRIELLELGAKENPMSPRAHYYLGREYFGRREWGKAIETLERYLALVGESCWHDEKGNALYYLAECYANAGMKEYAELRALRAVAESAGREPLLWLVKKYYKEERWHEALFFAELALTRDNNNAYFRSPETFGATLYDHLTMCYWHTGDIPSAIRAAAECVKMEPTNARFRSNYAVLAGAPAKLAPVPPPKDGLVVAYSITEDYSVHLEVTLYSLLSQNKVGDLYILSTGPENKRITDLAERFNVPRVFWVNLNEVLNAGLDANCPNRGSIYTDAALGRLFLPGLVAYDKVLYLDADTLVEGPLDELWNTDIEGFAVAGCRKTNWDGLQIYTERLTPGGLPDYINSGVLLMNLHYIRENLLDVAAIKEINTRRMEMPDQDAINIVCKDRIKTVDNRWNSSYSCGIAEEPKIMHFAAIKEFPYSTPWVAKRRAYYYDRDYAMKDNTIAAAYSITADWQDKLAVSMFSLLRHNSVRDLYIFVYGGKLNDTIYAIANLYGAAVNEIRLDPLWDKHIKNTPNRDADFSPAAWGRIFLADSTPEKRVLYFDADTIVHGPLDELWNTDIKKYAAAGVKDIGFYERWGDYAEEIHAGDKYINSGVMLINLDYWRKRGYTDKVYNLIAEHSYQFADQDVCNIVFDGRVLLLPCKWNSGRACGLAAPAAVSHFAGVKDFANNGGECRAWIDTAGDLARWLAKNCPQGAQKRE